MFPHKSLTTNNYYGGAWHEGQSANPLLNKILADLRTAFPTDPALTPIIQEPLHLYSLLSSSYDPIVFASPTIFDRNI